jgi:hypothetical protein
MFLIIGAIFALITGIVYIIRYYMEQCSRWRAINVVDNDLVHNTNTRNTRETRTQKRIYPILYNKIDKTNHIFIDKQREHTFTHQHLRFVVCFFIFFCN